MKDTKEEFRELFKNLPEVYKIKRSNVSQQTKSLTECQLACLLKIFINNDHGGEGLITLNELVEIIRTCLKFKTSKDEIIEMVKQSTGSDSIVDMDKINFATVVDIVDILKREKLFLVSLGNSLNYFIFVLLLVLMILYLDLFYSYKS